MNLLIGVWRKSRHRGDKLRSRCRPFDLKRVWEKGERDRREWQCVQTFCFLKFWGTCVNALLIKVTWMSGLSHKLITKYRNLYFLQILKTTRNGMAILTVLRQSP
ncbi:hypothetical protein L596_008713 [Steinernema carpocapsae]|uniref:Uncharacterized protein n=1 Tax=Steinernema carpocapsae TaxID=34508 RepID=A0A4U5PEF7_STECR|nr:hypothetical protein L596_008713 [Steinernema carpocapsae]